MGCGSSAAAHADRDAAGNATPLQEGAIASAAADEAASMIGGSLGLSSRLELSISAASIVKLDLTSASDPMAVVFERPSPQAPWHEIGRTEVISNTNDPKFVKLIKMQYRFEEQQYLRIALFDIDSTMQSQSTTVRLESQDFVGEIECQLAEIMGSRGSTLTKRITNKHNAARAKGTITVRGEEMTNANALVNMQLRAVKLANKDTFGKSDPFLRLSRVSETGPPTPFFKTNVIKNNLSPVFSPFALTMQRMCNGDPYRPVMIEAFDWDSDGSHELIGGCQTSLDDLMRRSQSGEGIALVNPSNRGKSCGMLHVMSATITPQPSFLDFISGGCELSFAVAIDFTGSNGHPSSPSSLHYVDPSGRPNQYQMAISAIGGVLEFYDADKEFPVFGFGGAPAPGHPVSHGFPLTDNSGSTACRGVAGIMQAYNRALSSVQLAGPTLFSQVLGEAMGIAGSSGVSQTNQKYFVLLIITDGIINDLDKTIELLVAASELPLSVLIVGVGNADFGMMEALDGDKKRLSYRGRPAARDIVQFVALKDHLVGGHGIRDVSRELLAEIPGQLLAFMKARSIMPNPRMPAAGGAPGATAVPPPPGPSAPMSGAGGASGVVSPDDVSTGFV